MQLPDQILAQLQANGLILSVDQVDDDNSINGFGGGSHTGTAYSSGVLTLNTTNNNAELDESWTPKWSNLLSYYQFEENSWDGTLGEVSEKTGNGNSGASVGTATTSTTSKIGARAGAFAGSGDRVNVPNHNTLQFTQNTAFTIMAWIKTASTAWGPILELRGPSQIISFRYCGSGWNDCRVNSLAIIMEETYPSDNFLVTTSLTHNLNNNRWNHVVVTYDGSNSATGISFYINNHKATNVVRHNNLTTLLNLTNDMRIGHNIDGVLDEIAIWNTDLTDEEVTLIYSRQSAKYAGEMKSRIIDTQDTNSSWTNLDWITTLPFGKELPSSSESSADYSSLVGSTGSTSDDYLMNGLVGLWHFNESTLGSAPDIGSGVTDFADSSANLKHCEAGGDTSPSKHGLLKSSVFLDGASDSLDCGTFDFLDGSTEMTISIWTKMGDGAGATHNIAIKDRPFQFQATPTVQLRYFNGSWNTSPSSTTSIQDNKWHHVVAVVDGRYVKIYIDGVEEVNHDHGSTITLRNFSGSTLQFGANNYRGFLDEAAIWSRALSAAEVVQVYRRGSNRAKYQVRACSSFNCSDKDARTGDGWKGPGGDYKSYFSELYNNSSINLNGCSPSAPCFESSLSLDGSVNTEPPSMGAAEGFDLDNNRYFQYRVIMESDDENTACDTDNDGIGDTTCMPELKSVEVGPSHTLTN